jgi:hypothetical protein
MKARFTVTDKEIRDLIVSHVTHKLGRFSGMGAAVEIKTERGQRDEDIFSAEVTIDFPDESQQMPKGNTRQPQGFG